MPGPAFFKALIASAAPVALVLVVLVLSGELSLGPAMVAGAVIVALLFGVFWTLLRDLHRISTAVAQLTEQPEQPAEPGDGSLLGRELFESVRRMVRAFAADRQRLAEKLKALEAQLERAPDPLLVVDFDQVIRSANAAARDVLESQQPTGRGLATVLRQPGLLDAVDLLLGGAEVSPTVEFEIGGQVRRQFRAHLFRIEGEAGGQGTILIAMQELTELKRAERMRADFVANASHELRTPLATLVGFIETLRGPARDDAAARERFLGIMHDQSERMTRLIRDLLSLSRIELNEHTRPAGRVDLREVAESVAGMLEPLARAKNMPMVVEGPKSGAVVMGDQDELVQVAQNLIDNAIKYGDIATPVTIRIQPEGANVTLAVTNQGEGIPREHLPRLTERFYRVDSARSRALGGTGLGLAIVKHIVNRHRGALSIESGEKQGATFKIALPIAPAPNGQAQPDAA